MNSTISRLPFFGALLVCIGLVYSPALQSAGVVLVFLAPFLNKRGKSAALGVFKDPFSLGLILFYILTLLSVFMAHNYEEYRRDILMKLPFLLLPIGLFRNEMTRREIKILLFVLSASVFSAGLISFVDYLFHFQEYNAQLFLGKPIPILWQKINHIYYSVLLAFTSFFLLAQLLLEKEGHRLLKWLAFALQFIFLHTIAARTGLAAFYMALISAAFWFALRRRNFILGIGLIVLIMAGTVSAIFFSPSIRNRLKFAEADIQTALHNKNPNHLSIATRAEALKVGWRVFLTRPITGVAPSNIQEKMYEEYKKENTVLMVENQVKPHNQFLESMIGLGILGLLVLLFIFLLPIFSKSRMPDAFFQLLLVGFWVICFTSMQVESILERQTGLTFFCLFYLILCHLRYSSNPRQSSGSPSGSSLQP